MKRKEQEITTLEGLYQSKGFECHKYYIYGNDGWINDPERRARIEEAAEYGCDGSTHGEVIQDWRDYLSTLKVIDPEWPEDGGEITEEAKEAIESEIDSCEQWHAKNGSLNQQGS